MVQRCLYSLVGFLQSRRPRIMRHGKSLVGAFAAAASVAGEPNAGVAVSPHWLQVCLVGVSPGVRIFRLLLFSSAVVRGFSSLNFSCLRRTQGQLLRSAAVFPALYIDVESFHVALTYVFVAELGAARTQGQLLRSAAVSSQLSILMLRAFMSRLHTSL